MLDTRASVNQVKFYPCVGEKAFADVTSPDGQNRDHIDYILCSQRWRSSTQSTKTRPGADCGSDHELLNQIQT